MAARLRRAADSDEWLDVTINNAIFGVMGEVRRPIADTLADLIDPTCTVKLKHVVVDDYRRNTLVLPVCSACGFAFDKRMPKPNFCPVCGARLVNDA